MVACDWVPKVLGGSGDD